LTFEKKRMTAASGFPTSRFFFYQASSRMCC
jgi:hypothetical protein